MRTWRDKANERIQALCMVEWRKANFCKNGKQYKKHRPYTVPLEAQMLVDCLREGDEHTAKCIFLHSYNAVVASIETERE